ncbi:aminopeptidase-like protein Y [Pleomassaria siparia CBS 279.74]|uniref:Peptide hydrolase n=1 Tax=Pleomassaria siparia CBS 279.74 TaxID=1314801 RepID=A0A6G1JUY7_9PLEO|nr:aminopeptidase-like protein Y [Pleomassaria siparia CBS 279.74]
MKIQSGLILAGAAQAFAASYPRSTYEPYRPIVKSKPLQDAITTDGLAGNLQKLNSIAEANNGNRAFGLPGYAASVDYILSRTANSSNFVTWTQDFPALFFKVESINFSVANISYHVIGFSYSPSTSREGVTAPLVLGAFGDAGCTNEGYDGLDVKGKIVIVQRGLCPDATTFAGRVRPAAAAGAAAVIMYATDDLTTTGGTLNSAHREKYVSAGYINKADGQVFVAKLQAGEEIEAYFQQTQTVETRITQNVFTETKEGDPANIIVLGAHLDSVQAGPGINDDGSGTSLILEVKTALEKFKVKNKVRFAWWAAEENGLLGSKAYTASLNATSANNMLAYLNFDMVSRGYFGVFDGDGSTHNLTGPPGSDVIEKLFVDDLTSKGINVTAARFTGGSDYQSFMNLGKPVGGLHTGTGVAQDPCYHQACDTIDNPNLTTLTVNAKTAAHVLSILATRGEQIIPKSTVNATMITSRGLIGREIEWTAPGIDEHHVVCGNNA